MRNDVAIDSDSCNDLTVYRDRPAGHPWYKIL